MKGFGYDTDAKTIITGCLPDNKVASCDQG